MISFKSIVVLPVLMIVTVLMQTGTYAADSVMAVFEPFRKATISTRVKSTILSRNKEFGDSFKAGEVLFVLDDLVYKLALAEARTQLESLKTELTLQHKEFQARPYDAYIEKAKAEYAWAVVLLESRKQLFKDISVSRSQLEESVAKAAIGKADIDIASRSKDVGYASFQREVSALEAKIKTAERTLILAQRDLESCKIVAPYPGRVANNLVNEHESVQAGQQLVEIIDDKQLLARILLQSNQFDKLKIGQKLDIYVIENSKTVKGEISNIDAIIDPASSTIKVWLKVDNSSGNLRGGMRGKVVLSESSKGN
jgi:multidrug resistance efflux pump